MMVMKRIPPPGLRSAALVVVLVLVLSGCGSGGSDKKTIRTDKGATLIRQLRKARDAAGDPKKCPQLQRAVAAAQATAESLPRSVDHDTRATLTNGIRNLQDSATQDCAGVKTDTETTPTETAPTTETQAPPTTTKNTPPPTTPPTTHTTPPPTQTPPTTTTPPPPNGGATPGQGGTPPGQQKKKGKGHAK